MTFKPKFTVANNSNAKKSVRAIVTTGSNIHIRVRRPAGTHRTTEIAE